MLHRQLDMRHYRTHSTFGDRAFAAAGSRLWNSLLPHLRVADLPYSRSDCTVSQRSGPAVTKDIFVCTVGPWHSVNYFNRAV